MATLTLIDLVGIQGFVFASNRLKDVVGGSRIVGQATSREGWLADLGADDRALVAAGGNVLLRSETPEEARELVARFTRKLIDEAPGLSAAVAHVPLAAEGEDGGFAQALRRLHQRMREAKAERRPSLELQGVGVTERCRETGTVASAVAEEDGRLVSSGVLARRTALDRFELVVEKGFQPAPEAPTRELRFPIKNDDLGRSAGEKSLLGVVHVDANRVGSRLADWLKERSEAEGPDGEVEERFRSISSGLTELVQEAWKDVLERVNGQISWNPSETHFELTSPVLRERFVLGSDDRRLFLPVRPILLGGDDLTFLCDGRIALDLAETALARFERSAVPELGRLGACAGVALVHAHAPFSRAAEWADRLCTSAKRFLTKRGSAADAGEDCALDWHVGLPSPQETVDGVRERLYQRREDADTEELTCRPYRLGTADEPETWRWLARTVLGPGPGPTLRGATWRGHRNKVKELESLVRGGQSSITGALEAWQIAAPHLRLPGGLDEPGGFLGGRTPLLDAVELMDLHWPLRGEGVTEGATE